jgi:hypothetical protein
MPLRIVDVDGDSHDIDDDNGDDSDDSSIIVHCSQLVIEILNYNTHTTKSMTSDI